MMLSTMLQTMNKLHRLGPVMVLAMVACLLSTAAFGQDGQGDYSPLAVEAETKPKKAAPTAPVRTEFEFFALPFKAFDGDALGTGLSLELAIPGWNGIRVGATGHRSLSQNSEYYLTDVFFGAYGKFFFHSALHRYGISPFATAGIGFYRVDGEAIDKRKSRNKVIDSTSLALSGGVHYQYNKRFAGYGEYQIHSGEGSLNTLQVGLSVLVF